MVEDDRKESQASIALADIMEAKRKAGVKISKTEIFSYREIKRNESARTCRSTIGTDGLCAGRCSMHRSVHDLERQAIFISIRVKADRAFSPSANGNSFRRRSHGATWRQARLFNMHVFLR